MIFAYVVLSLLAAYAVLLCLITASLTGKTPEVARSASAVFAVTVYLASLTGLWIVQLNHLDTSWTASAVAALLVGLYTWQMGSVVSSVDKPRRKVTSAVVLTGVTVHLVELGALAFLFTAVR